MRTPQKTSRTRLSILAMAVAIVGAVGVAFAASAGAGVEGPTLTSTPVGGSTVHHGDTLQIHGTGCPAASQASVLYVENAGTANENVYKTDFPVLVDANGAFDSSGTVPDSAEIPSTLDVHAKCGNPAADVPDSTLSFSVAAAETTTTTTAPADTAPAAQAVDATPTLTG